MSIFNRLRGSSGGDTALAQAVLTPAVSTMIGDGEVDSSEIAQLINACSFSPVFFQLKESDLKGLIPTIIKEIKANGHDAAIQAAAGKLSPALRETALCFAVRIALADGKIEDGEKASLGQTAHHMQIAPDTFGKIFEVMVMMQRGPNAQTA